MKKFLVLTLVLGMVSLANAGLILTADGMTGAEVEIGADNPLVESDTVLLGLELDTEMMGYQITYLLDGPGEFLYDAILFPVDTQLGGKVNDGGVDWVEITDGNMFGSVVGPAILMEGLLIHCLGPGVVTVDVIVSGSTDVEGAIIPLQTLLQTITVHQIPEPMTLALLGLGGLFLRRRK